jgi:hypothetical protein
MLLRSQRTEEKDSEVFAHILCASDIRDENIHPIRSHSPQVSDKRLLFRCERRRYRSEHVKSAAIGRVTTRSPTPQAAYSVRFRYSDSRRQAESLRLAILPLALGEFA